MYQHFMQTWQRWAKTLKQQTLSLYIASKDPRVPLTAKLLLVIIVAYALSPIDLIPDFIPVIGYLDDLLLLPLGIWLVIKLIPAPVWQACQQQARQLTAKPQTNRIAAIVIIAVWIFITVLFMLWLWPD